ncbi:TIR domain-containing protein [Rhodococcus cercidiphylli]|uniref:TIR domain-containing protein n=1 Tax=Rhodococcus cercidiphylli TaxID=489916 RepID=A0ABU4AZV4_9NOCA|nr:TIR domain-containing protein [Rhodococcus cercidiphylli]MDV6231775.1 TIR domain-containing protein [Rhodococcus cercidiphylli]
MGTLANQTRRKCFISYHHSDEREVQQFIQTFDHDQDILIARGIGASMSGDIINSSDNEYIKSQIRAKYLRDTTVTLVLVGRETWGRKFVDWEVAASLRNTSTATASGLLAVTLASAANYHAKQLPPRVEDNVNGQVGYARWWKYPASTSLLAEQIEAAYDARTTRADLRDNSRALRSQNH